MRSVSSGASSRTVLGVFPIVGSRSQVDRAIREDRLRHVYATVSCHWVPSRCLGKLWSSTISEDYSHLSQDKSDQRGPREKSLVICARWERHSKMDITNGQCHGKTFDRLPKREIEARFAGPKIGLVICAEPALLRIERSRRSPIRVC